MAYHTEKNMWEGTLSLLYVLRENVSVLTGYRSQKLCSTVMKKYTFSSLLTADDSLAWKAASAPVSSTSSSSVLHDALNWSAVKDQI